MFGAFGLLLTVSLFTAGGYLVQSVTEEKQNRVMEVLVSSIKPDQLMFGKLIGLGAVGLLLVAVWAVSGTDFPADPRPRGGPSGPGLHLLARRADIGAGLFSARLRLRRHPDGGYRRRNYQPAGGEQHHRFRRAAGSLSHLVCELSHTGSRGRGCAGYSASFPSRLRSRA